MSKDGILHVSVILPSYNCAETIEKAILSFIEQDYESKELIIVDGKSTDGTLDLIHKHENSIDFFVCETDNGVYDAMNKGIDIATGDWIYFLGGDDCFFDNKVLSRIFTSQITSKIVYGNVLLKGDGPVGNTGEVYNGEFSQLKLCCKSMCQQAIFYHTSLFDEYGKFNLRYAILADWAFNIMVFSYLEEQPKYVEEVIAIYDTEGLSGTKKDQNFIRDRLKLVNKYYGFYYSLLCRIFLLSRKSPFLYRLIRLSRSMTATTKHNKR